MHLLWRHAEGREVIVTATVDKYVRSDGKHLIKDDILKD